VAIISTRAVALTAAGLLALATPTAAAPSGRYGGSTSQKEGGSALLITLTVADGALTDVNVDAIVEQGGSSCLLNGDGGISFDFRTGRVPIARQGKFDGQLTAPGGESIKISGHVTSHTADGSFDITEPALGQGATACSSGNVTFTTIAAGGQEKNSKYSGTVGPGYPITFRISADGNAVDDLEVGIEATCQPGAGDVAPVYDFKTLRITSGSFSGRVFEQQGSNESNLIGISGTFFGRTAVGEVTDLAHIKSLPNCTMTEPFTATAS
jgi:hypothetical protein